MPQQDSKAVLESHQVSGCGRNGPPGSGSRLTHVVDVNLETSLMLPNLHMPQIETRQTFTLILPNLIHKSKRRNLTKRN